MKPTVGRIVHYHDAKAGLANGDGPYAAIVTEVGDNGRVSLTVFLPHASDVMSVSDCPSTDEPIKQGAPYWSWPPRE